MRLYLPPLNLLGAQRRPQISSCIYSTHSHTTFKVLKIRPLDAVAKAVRVEQMFYQSLVEANVINEAYAKTIAKFFGAHHAVQDPEPHDLTVRLLDINDISGIDRTAMYLLFTWTKTSIQCTAVVKVASDVSINIVIRFVVCVSPTESQSRIEWFSWPNSDPLKDILIASSKELGLITSQSFKTIWFYKSYHFFIYFS